MAVAAAAAASLLLLLLILLLQTVSISNGLYGLERVVTYQLITNIRI